MGRTYDSTYNLYTSPRILHSGASVPMLDEAWHSNQVLNNSCVYNEFCCTLCYIIMGTQRNLFTIPTPTVPEVQGGRIPCAWNSQVKPCLDKRKTATGQCRLQPPEALICQARKPLNPKNHHLGPPEVIQNPKPWGVGLKL